jgi:hypothetical protein
MTEQDKQLLLIDLSARLPYGVNIQVYYEEIGGYGYFDEIVWSVDNDKPFHVNDRRIEDIKPYLRPMSSMTEEERKYISDKCGFSISGPIGGECGLIMPVLAADWLIDFYNEHHIDYRGLIPMGLALEAPEGMYKTE